jgi:8-hydroxy-5-deazaflavin:NADPH oxidoreductase
MARWLEGTGLVMMGLGRYSAGNFNFSLDVNIPG